MDMHKSVTVNRIVRLVRQNQRDMDSFKGVCLHCGKTANGCEPDAREYTCHKCNQPRVYGAEEILMMIV